MTISEQILSLIDALREQNLSDGKARAPDAKPTKRMHFTYDLAHALVGVALQAKDYGL